jgi:hypothetical protein
MVKIGKKIMQKSKRQNPPKCYQKGELSLGCESCEWYWQYRNTPWWVKEKGKCYPRD